MDRKKLSGFDQTHGIGHCRRRQRGLRHHRNERREQQQRRGRGRDELGQLRARTRGPIDHSLSGTVPCRRGTKEATGGD